jgi:hypothetical protein
VGGEAARGETVADNKKTADKISARFIFFLALNYAALT